MDGDFRSEVNKRSPLALGSYSHACLGQQAGDRLGNSSITWPGNEPLFWERDLITVGLLEIIARIMGIVCPQAALAAVWNICALALFSWSVNEGPQLGFLLSFSILKHTYLSVSSLLVFFTDSFLSLSPIPQPQCFPCLQPTFFSLDTHCGCQPLTQF